MFLEALRKLHRLRLRGRRSFNKPKRNTKSVLLTSLCRRTPATTIGRKIKRSYEAMHSGMNIKRLKSSSSSSFNTTRLFQVQGDGLSRPSSNSKACTAKAVTDQAVVCLRGCLGHKMQSLRVYHQEKGPDT